MARAMRVARPDLTFVIENVVSGGDRVVLRWTARGTHSGAFGEQAAINRRVERTGMDLFRVVGGRIFEPWGNNDAMGLWDQLS